MLRLVNAIGGGVLWILIGAKAYVDNETGRNYRLGAGALIVGWAIGFCVYYFVWNKFPDASVTKKRVTSFLVIPIAIVLFTFLLENVSKSLG